MVGYLALMRVNNKIDFLARTVWGEARGEGAPGMAAVAAVVMNRVVSPRYPDTVQGVVLQDWQFSVWNIADPNRLKVLAVSDSDPDFRQALAIAADAVNGRLPDPTGGATHYHTVNINPYWRDDSKRTVTIGNHIFYAGIA